MQRGAVTLKSEERYSEEKEMEGYGPGNVFILCVTRMFTNHLKSYRGDVASSGELGLTCCPSKQAKS